MNASIYLKLRKGRGLSQEQAAHLVGVTATTWRAWEHEVSRPSALAKARLACLFKAELDRLRPAWYTGLPATPAPSVG